MEASDFRSLRPELKDRLDHIREDRVPLGLYLDRLEDPRNIGRLFRLADAARLSELIMGGAEADWQPDKKVRRFSRSTIDYVPHYGLPKAEELDSMASNRQVLVLEKTERSRLLWEFEPDPRQKYLLVLGNEKQGVQSGILQLDFPHYHLPMLGINTSMNVAQAAAIAVYYFLEKWTKR